MSVSLVVPSRPMQSYMPGWCNVELLGPRNGAPSSVACSLCSRECNVALMLADQFVLHARGGVGPAGDLLARFAALCRDVHYYTPSRVVKSKKLPTY